MTETVYVALSGGVDSSVAAALLKERGFHVVGVFMKPWSSSAEASDGQAAICPWKRDREDALRVAAVLGIPLETWDFSRQYEASVTRYMVGGYRKGITPNPDVMCNKEIKFGLFFKEAMRRGADYIATGHYARKKESRKWKIEGGKRLSTTHYSLLSARDGNKDQTYFLWTLTQKQLARTLFPVGDLIKPEVRMLARKFGLPNHDKKDSQGVCFVGPLDVKEFLARHIKRRTGVVKHTDGRTLGEHDGAYYYTIGQRHGLDLGIAGGPYYVTRKDVRRNIVYVGGAKDLLGQTAHIAEMHWIAGAAPAIPASIDAKIRYRTKVASATLHRGGLLRFKTLQRAITPGQSAVFYRGHEVLGGGVIRSAA